MPESECAGVLFIKNPASNTDEVLINASYGLGEAVVSGLVSPDEYRCDRSGNVRLVTIGSKENYIYNVSGVHNDLIAVALTNNDVTEFELEDAVCLW